MSKSKDIGTRFETAVVRWLRLNGWPHAERRALAGAGDLGDITGTPGLAWECKAGAAAHDASDAVLEKWMRETETERVNAAADIGILVVARRRVGDRPERVGRHWALLRGFDVFGLPTGPGNPVRVHLATAVKLLRASGYGDPLPGEIVDDPTGAPLETGPDGALRPRRALIGPRMWGAA